MTVTRRYQGSSTTIPLVLTGATATALPTVSLFTDAGLTTPYSGAARTVTGAVPGSSFTWTSSDLPVGTYYVREQAQTANGTLTNSTDVLIVDPATIGSSSSNATPQDVADQIAQRVLTKDGNAAGTFDATTVPTDAQVSRLIDLVAGEELGGLGTIPPHLTGMARSVVALATAVRVLGVYFSGDGTRDDLDADLDQLRERFRSAIDTWATTGDPGAVSADGNGDGDRPPAPAWSFPETRAADTVLFGVPVTTLTERY